MVITFEKWEMGSVTDSKYLKTDMYFPQNIHSEVSVMNSRTVITNTQRNLPAREIQQKNNKFHTQGT